MFMSVSAIFPWLYIVLFVTPPDLLCILFLDAIIYAIHSMSVGVHNFTNYGA